MSITVGDCCMDRHIQALRQAITPWTCDCPCHAKAKDAEAEDRAADKRRLLRMAATLGFTYDGNSLTEPVHDIHVRVGKIEDLSLEVDSRLTDLEGKADDFERDMVTESWVEDEIDRRVEQQIDGIPTEDKIREIAEEAAKDAVDDAKSEYEGLCQVRDDWDRVVGEVESLREDLSAANREIAELKLGQDPMLRYFMQKGWLPCGLCHEPAGTRCAAQCSNPEGRPQYPPSLAFFAYMHHEGGPGTMPSLLKAFPAWVKCLAMWPLGGSR